MKGHIMISKKHKKISLLLAMLVVANWAYTADNHTINHLFELNKHASLYIPKTVTELQQIVKQAALEQKRISLVGADKSQGGQTISSDKQAVRISLKNLNRLLMLDLAHKEVTVEAGMTWAELQKHIVHHGMAIKAMQSYHDFAIGGSLSVNVHGQDILYAPLITTVKEIKIMLANGNIVTASRTENSDLFSAAIGGYGLIGIIIEATLSLTDDVLLERHATLIDAHELSNYFLTHVKNNPKTCFYSARFSMGSNDLLEKALVITYEYSNQHNQSLFALASPTKDLWKKPLIELTSRVEIIKNWRMCLESLYNNMPQTISRNNFLNYSIETLPQERADSYNILQEYFIPYNQINAFLDYLKIVVQTYHVNLINITARHVPQNDESMLSYSKQDVCAFVLFINVDKNRHAYQRVASWTNKLIDKAIACQGVYYLPYHLLSTQEQLEKAYPRFQEFVQLKRSYDPQELFSNALYEKYT